MLGHCNTAPTGMFIYQALHCSICVQHGQKYGQPDINRTTIFAQNIGANLRIMKISQENKAIGMSYNKIIGQIR